MKAISKLWQRFGELINKIPFTFVLPLAALIALVALAVAVMVSEDTESCLQKLLGLEGKYDVLKNIGFCIAGVLLVWQAWMTNKRAKAMEKTAENTKAGQQEERLKNAIEHLGHKSETVCMGGAYGLFHLAKGTEDLRQTVLKILCAHIRQKTGEDEYKEKNEKNPSAEIQGMLTLLFAQKDGVIFKGCPINLQGSYLNGANLKHAQLQDANLRDAQLQQTQLQGANFSNAQLQRADLFKTQLQGANFSKARMQGADLSKARMQGADLMEAQLQGADLRQAQMQGVSSQKTDHLPSAEFESRIKNRIDKHSSLTGIIFAGGLQQKDLDTLCKDLSAKKAQALQKKLTPHVGQPASHELPPDSDAKTDAYTKKEAERWIAEYNKDMQKAPKADDTANADSAPDSDKGKGD